ncbi:MAG: hypothetical protein WAU88_10210 [Candidatus Zixiibacteriota bacterium]
MEITQRTVEMLRRLLTSFLWSFGVVGGLVGNAYVATSVGYPGFLQWIGMFFVMVGFVVAIPPGLFFSLLTAVGLGWELRGRESFVESNPGLWVYCVVFYTFFVFAIRTWWQRHKRKKALSNEKIVEGA